MNHIYLTYSGTISYVYILVLNDMRSSNYETMTTVARANSIQELVDLVESELTTPYRDGQWNKSFRAGGPLEWFNPPVGKIEKYVINFTEQQQRAHEELEKQKESVLREVPTVEFLRKKTEQAISEVTES